MIGYLNELGYSSSSGFGAVPLAFTEINAWMQATGLSLNPWEVLTIKRLSSEYVAQLGRSTDKNCGSPYIPREAETVEKQRAITDSFFRNLSKRGKNDRHRPTKRKSND